MARYVVLYFDDNEHAQTFAEAAGGRFAYEGDIVALVPAPTLFCDGTPIEKHRGIKKDGFFRGKKYGWWVCIRCGKPKEAWGSNYAAVISSGVNLLKAVTHVERKEPEAPNGWAQ